jgi:carbamoyl-phosphate synthase large subunit
MPGTSRFVAVPRTRGKIINGQATGGQTVDDADVRKFAEEICEAFGSANVCCVQIMRAPDTGLLYFIEFNPRYGTGVSLSFAAGIDFLDLQRQAAEGEEICWISLHYKIGLGMARYWKECFYTADETETGKDS